MLKRLLIFLFIIVLLANVFIVSEYSYYVTTWARLISSFIFFIYFLIFKDIKSKTILIVFILLTTANVFLLDIEDIQKSRALSIIKIVAYFLLIRKVYTKLKIPKLKFLNITLSIMVLANLALIYPLLFETNHGDDHFKFVLRVIYALTLISLSIISVNYNIGYSSKRSLYFLYLAFSFSYSDICWFIAYYMDFKFFFYVDITLYITALFFMIRYVLQTKSTDDVLPE